MKNAHILSLKFVQHYFDLYDIISFIINKGVANNMAQNNKNDSNKEIHIDTATEHFGNFRNYTVAPKNKDVKTVDTMKKGNVGNDK